MPCPSGLQCRFLCPEILAKCESIHQSVWRGMTPALQGHLEFFPCFCQRPARAVWTSWPFSLCPGRGNKGATKGSVKSPGSQGARAMQLEKQLPPSPAKELSPSPAADKGRDKRLSESQILFQWRGGNVPRVLFFPSGCQHPVLLKALCWSEQSPSPLGTAFLRKELGGGRSRKHRWFSKETTSPEDNTGASGDHRFQAAQHLKLS